MAAIIALRRALPATHSVFTASARWAVLSGRTLSEVAGSSSANAKEAAEAMVANHIPSADVKEKLLESAFLLVPQYGWTTEALCKAAESIGLSSAAHGMCVNGPVDLVDYFLKKSHQQLVTDLEQTDMTEMPMAERVRTGIIKRLKLTEPFADQWGEALRVMGCSLIGQQKLHMSLYETVDEILSQAEDESVDFDWYCKRASLAAIYSSTELFMATDSSYDHQRTYTFFNRRFNDLLTVAAVKSQMGDVVGGVTQSIGRVLGMV